MGIFAPIGESLLHVDKSLNLATFNGGILAHAGTYVLMTAPRSSDGQYHYPATGTAGLVNVPIETGLELSQPILPSSGGIAGIFAPRPKTPDGKDIYIVGVFFTPPISKPPSQPTHH
ncbi:hypothetical protein [Granulicella tundricola]|uniref:Uncharacterized protein n=1 Tax=Granulicella tundricola (strain ATCC BAA-1859 / DSM 23138 / MP5ACTX9) TaxID=1198114 RepID=E8WYA1_GRATM|nr:hypothetical protein [Granulicella tundricola]ADW68728.1 hypothetical protein AciX9_1678 [Granulicella tundricola MP5ACTX9]